MESFLNSRADRGIIYQGTDFSVDILYSLLPVIMFLGRKKMLGFTFQSFFNQLKDNKR